MPFLDEDFWHVFCKPFRENYILAHIKAGQFRYHIISYNWFHRFYVVLFIGIYSLINTTFWTWVVYIWSHSTICPLPTHPFSKAFLLQIYNSARFHQESLTSWRAAPRCICCPFSLDDWYHGLGFCIIRLLMTDILFQAIDSLIPRDWREWTAINLTESPTGSVGPKGQYFGILVWTFACFPWDAPVQVQWVERLTQIQPNVPGLLPLFHWCSIWGTPMFIRISLWPKKSRRKGKVDFLCRCLVSYPLSPHPPLFGSKMPSQRVPGNCKGWGASVATVDETPP